MDISYRSIADRALILTAGFLAPVIESVLRPNLAPGESWTVVLRTKDEHRHGARGRYAENDPHCVLRVLSERLDGFGSPFEQAGSREVSRYAGELRDARNLLSHGQEFNEADTFRLIDTAKRLVALLAGDDDAAEIDALKAQLIAGPSVAELEAVPLRAVNKSELTIEIAADLNLYYGLTFNGISPVKAVTISNVGAEIVDALVRVDITASGVKIAEPWIVVQSLPEGESVALTDVCPLIDMNAILQVTDATPGLVSVTIEKDGAVLVSASSKLVVESPRVWRSSENNLIGLAAYVTPNDPLLESFLKEVGARLALNTGDSAINPYQQDEPAQRVNDIARAIFEAAWDRGIQYSSPPASWIDGQAIRTATEVLEGGVGTCLDTTVVLAAAMEQSGIHPIVVVVNGHAFLAYWLVPESLQAEEMIVEAQALAGLVESGKVATIETTAVCQRSAGATRPDWTTISREPFLNRLVASQEEFIVALNLARLRERIKAIPVRTIDLEGNVVISKYETPATVAPQPVVSSRVIAGKAGRGEIPPRVAQWKNALLDLSKRNRLINVNRDRHVINLLAPSSIQAQLEDRINSGAAVALSSLLDEGRAGAADARRLADSSETQLVSDLWMRSTVAVNLGPEAYVSKLRALAYQARSIAQETGANNLYLAFGTMHWEIDGDQLQSPLILVPVRLETANRGKSFKVVVDESGESTPNYCLLEKLRVTFGLQIPALYTPVADASGIDLEATFQATREALAAANPSFRVEPTVDLGIFQFAKFRLWKDLDDNWESLAENSLVRHLIYTPALPFVDPVDSVESVDLDELGALCPIPADASQVQAVADAVAGRTFVLEGPPGTGKSQTISNILARAIADGKKVLFVAEKSEALSVVKKRLDAAGLGAFTLDVHNKSSKPSAVRAQLLEALDNTAAMDSQTLDAARQSLLVARKVLARYTENLHERNTADLSLYGAQQSALAIDPDLVSIPVPEELLTSGSDETFRQLSALFGELSGVVGSTRPSTRHPWRFVDADPAELDQNTILEASRALDESLDQLRARGLGALIDSISNTGQWEAIAAIAGSPWLTVDLADTAGELQWQTAAADQVAAVKVFASTPHPALNYLSAKALTLDAQSIHQAALAADTAGLFGRKKARLAVLSSFDDYVKAGSRIKLKSLSTITAALVDLAARAATIRAGVFAVPGLNLGSEWNPSALADIAALEYRLTFIDWATTILGRGGSFAAPLKASLAAGNLGSPELPSELETARARFADFRAAIGDDDESIDDWRGEDGFLGRWIATRTLRGEGDARVRSLGGWMKVLTHVEPLVQLGLIEAREGILNGTIDPDTAPIAFAQGLATASLREREREMGLVNFDGRSHGHSIERFRASLTAIRNHLPTAIPHEVLARRTFDSRSTAGQVGLLRRELERQRGGLSVRGLFTKYIDVITSLTPCIMMSPESVARFFSASPAMFDIAIFDEASQLRVADSVGAMGRARSVIVVGDSRQMPPTSIAEASSIGAGSDEYRDDDDESVVDQESILTECVQALVPQQWLSWHYRSQDESLIAFSNREYYRGKLSSFPTPLSGSRDDGVDGYGISMRRVAGEYFPGGSAANGRAANTNPVEARAVVDEVQKRFAASPDVVPSLGIVTFNKPQAALIFTLLNELGDDRLLRSLEADDGVFVKNIESVQGDERDTILFSVGRSADAKGRVPLTFGPLNLRGGERRLNVAITRARRQVMMFCSFEPHQLIVEGSQSQGVRDLRAYIDLASKGSDSIEFDATQFRHVDRHRDAIADRLRDRSLGVTANVGLSDFKVDLAVASATVPDKPLMAVLLDGPDWARRLTVADRDALPGDVLTGLMNWPRVERVWLPDWLHDEDSVIDRLVRSIEEASEGLPQPEPDAREIPIFAAAPTEAPKRHVETRPSGPVFREWPWTYAGTVDVLDYLPYGSATSQVREVLLQIVEAEGPIHLARLAKLAASAFGLSRVSSVRESAILRALPAELVPDVTSPFAWPSSVFPDSWEDFRSSTEGSGRTIQMIPWQEIVNAVRAAATASMALTEAEAKREALSAFGIRRLTDGIDVVLVDALRRGLAAGRLERDTEGLLKARD